jgi:predicted  nucleic acid-binding Zn-ribbon protein
MTSHPAAMNITERLSALSAEIAEERTQLAILEEQVAFQSEVADDARIRSLVSETPLADREARIASEDLQRMVRSRDESRQRLEELRGEQDALLERMSEAARES